MTGGIKADLTLHMEVLDPQAMWDHAFYLYVGAQLDYKVYDSAEPTRLGDELHDGFVALCSTRDDPDIGQCLRVIFEPDQSPPGVQINGNLTAAILSRSLDDQYSFLVAEPAEIAESGISPRETGSSLLLEP